MPAVQLVPLRHGEPEPAQVPALQTSVVVHPLPSVQALPVVDAQVPFTAAPAATLQAWQSFVAPPPHAVLQQTPSVQKPLAHCAAPVHAAPAGRPKSTLATKASTPPAFAVRSAPVVAGKSAEFVYPVTYAAPAPSTAMPTAMSTLVPPR